MDGENSSAVCEESLDDSFDLDIRLYPASAAEEEAFVEMPNDMTVMVCTQCPVPIPTLFLI